MVGDNQITEGVLVLVPSTLSEQTFQELDLFRAHTVPGTVNRV